MSRNTTAEGKLRLEHVTSAHLTSGPEERETKSLNRALIEP
jgi:hypothetical protein